MVESRVSAALGVTAGPIQGETSSTLLVTRATACERVNPNPR